MEPRLSAVLEGLKKLTPTPPPQMQGAPDRSKIKPSQGLNCKMLAARINIEQDKPEPRPKLAGSDEISY